MSAPSDHDAPAPMPATGSAETSGPSRPGRGWNVTGWLRIGGTAALTIALAQFLLVGLHVENDLQRFGLLLLQTGLFTGGAFVLQRFLQDLKSARLLIGVSLVSVVAGFAVLGAMLYDVFGPDVVAVSNGIAAADPVPAFMQWQGGSAVRTLLAAIAAAIVLLPTARFGFAVLARFAAARLTAITTLASLALLVPVRDPGLMGLLAAGTLLSVTAAQRGLLHRHPALATMEGRFARTLPFLPIAVLLARTLLLHEIEPGFVLPLAIAVWILVRCALAASPTTVTRQAIGYGVGLIAITLAALAISSGFDPLMNPAAIVITTTIVPIGLLELRRHVTPTHTVLTLDATLLLLAGTGVGVITLLGGVLSSSDAWLLVATLPLIGYAIVTRRPALVLILLCLIGLQALVMLDHLLALLDGYGWQGLVGIGLVALVSAGVIERRRSLRRGSASEQERGEVVMDV